MKRLFTYPYLSLSAIMFYPSTVLIWLCEPKEMRKIGYLNLKDFIKQLHNELS